MYRCVLINAPFVFRATWKIVSKFIDPLTVAKIKVLGEDYLEEMSEIIPLDQIPEKFGGKGTNPIKPGHSADLPHDRYPLNFYDSKEMTASNEGSDVDAKADIDVQDEVKEQ